MTEQSPAEAVFFATLKRGSAAERAAYLEEACAGQPELLAQVAKLLAAHPRVGDFLADPTPGATATFSAANFADNGDTETQRRRSTDTEQVGTVIAGRYKLLERVGEGGMGSVWMADQTDPVKRKVAVKLIKTGMDTKMVLARFEAERQALALMDHPNIAKVLDGGKTDAGQPFFVMELVKGVPITDFCDSRKLTPQQRLELFVPVCQAIQHAHQKGVIHRDIKPSNVLVALYDDRPVPKVIDFGVVKATGPTLTEHTLNTGFGGLVGTPQYMSPEQATFNNLDIDTRSDVYSLGVLLYELLVGSPPFTQKELEKRGLLEILRVVREDEPPKPSTKLSTADALPGLSASRGMEPKKLTGLLRNELDWIVMKALEKDRTRRYETANGFATDVQRYLNGEPVQAHPPTASYRLRKFVRKNRGPVVAGSLVFATLVLGIAGTSLGFFRAEQAKSRESEHGSDGEREAKAQAMASEAKAINEKKRAIEFRDKALDALQATTGEDVEKLIGEKSELGASERIYLEAIAKRWQAFAEQTGTDEDSRRYQAEGRFRVGSMWGRLGRHEEARTEYRLARDLYSKLVEEFPEVTQHQTRLALTRNNLGLDLAKLGERAAAETEHRAAIKLSASLVTRFPGVVDHEVALADSHSNLATVLDELGQHEQAMLEYRAAHEFRLKHVERFPDDPDYLRRLAASHNNLGMMLHDIEQIAQSLVEYRAACDLHAKLMARFPGVAEFHYRLAGSRTNLGSVLSALGRTEEAAAEHRAARDLHRKLAEQYPTVPTYQEGQARAHYNLGVVLAQMGKPTEARGEYRAAVVLREKLVSQYPTVPVYRERLASSRLGLGNILKELGQTTKALEEYQAAREPLNHLTERFPDVAEYRNLLSQVHFSTGLIPSPLGEQAELQTARDLQKKLVQQFPERVEYRKNLASTCNMLGCLLTNLKQWDESRTELQAAIDLKMKLVEQYPNVINFQINLGGVYCNYAMVFLREGQPAKSLEWFDRAIGILQPINEREPRNAQVKGYLINSYWSRSQAYRTLKMQRESLADWDRVVELSPREEQPKRMGVRATLRYQAGMFAEAITDVQEAMKVDHWTAMEIYNFACIYSVASGKIAEKKTEYADRSMELLQKAVKAGQKDHAHMKRDTDLDPLRARDDFKKLLAELEAKFPPK